MSYYITFTDNDCLLVSGLFNLKGIEWMAVRLVLMRMNENKIFKDNFLYIQHVLGRVRYMG